MADLYFTETHEWVQNTSDSEWLIGISDFAQNQLGDAVYVELPAIGADIKQGDSFAVIESVKAANEIYAPISGTVIAINERLQDEPNLVNSAAQSDGWLIRVQAAQPELSHLLSLSHYQKFCDAS